jgi:histidinol-phosphate aminotransferase
MLTIPAHLTSLPAYVPGEAVETLAARLGRSVESIIKLDANENPYGPPPAVKRALAEISTYQYPDSEQRHLRAALAAYTGIPAEFLVAGNGSDELLSLLAQILLEPGDSILVCPPTFSMYAFYAKVKNCRVVNVPRRADFSLDMEGIIYAVQTESPKMILIDNPGNPTGLNLPIADIEKLLDLPTLIVLDEAYIEFADTPSFITRVPERENLVVLRTFSKWAGLAGMRVGYGAFPKWISDVLWQAKSPYNLTHPASIAATAALSDIDYLIGNIQRLRDDRERLAAALRRFNGLTVYPSAANFLLVRVDAAAFGKSATEICNSLKEQGILVRLFEPMNCTRITIGLPEHIEALLTAFQKLA